MTHNHPVPEIKANTYVQMPGFTKDMHDTIEEGISLMDILPVPDELKEGAYNYVMWASDLCGRYRQSIGKHYHQPPDPNYIWTPDLPF